MCSDETVRSTGQGNRPYGAAGHRHPGPEAWYGVSGGQCLETPNGMILANAGQAAMVPEGWPMAISSVGRDTRRALVLILLRSDRPYSWRSTTMAVTARRPRSGLPRPRVRSDMKGAEPCLRTTRLGVELRRSTATR
jgi:hypothetical protein